VSNSSTGVLDESAGSVVTSTLISLPSSPRK
jgi:hypothetical protein